ncbi:MAG: thioesterase [Clostridiales bacterium]|nr:thioesterase [Candidatus Scatonaster coprocaballi]
MTKQMFALPYAGGSASIYNEWTSRLKNIVDVRPIEYAGHASRFCEDFYSSIEEAAEDISEMIRKQQQGDYVIYGHSMGCLVALETVFTLQHKGIVLPKALIVSGTRPPHLMYKDKPLGTLSKDSLMKEIVSLGQFDPEVLECEELLEMIADIMYADVQMFSKYQRHYKMGTIDMPILAMCGDSDPEAPAEDVKEWQKYTTGDFTFQSFSGGHFFAFNENEAFIQYITQYLCR